MKYRRNIIAFLTCLMFMPLAAFAQYSVAACDWMMLKRQKLGEFKLAWEIGTDGVEVDMGPLGNRVVFDNQLRRPEQAGKFVAAAKEFRMQVPSMAMSGFFAQSFLLRANYKELLVDCFETMRLFGSKVAFLPLGGSGTGWQQKGAERDSMVMRLRTAGYIAQSYGITIGIRTGLSAKKNVELLKQVNSPAVKIYYNLQDAADANRDICKELKQLGRERIVQIHCSNTDSVNLEEDPEIDLPAIKRTLDDMHWSGWLVVERSRDVTRVRDVKYNYSRNVAYIRKVFNIDNK